MGDVNRKGEMAIAEARIECSRVHRSRGCLMGFSGCGTGELVGEDGQNDADGSGMSILL